MSTPGVSSSPCHAAGRQPAKHIPRGPWCAGTTQTTVCRAQARQRCRKAFGSWSGAAILAARTVSCPPDGTSAVSQPRGDDARELFQLREPGTHVRCGLDRGPSTIRRTQRTSQRAATGADIEQIADVAHVLTDEGCNSRDVIGGVDGRDVELDGIDALGGADEISWRPQRSSWIRSTSATPGRERHENTRGNHPSPRTAAVSPLPPSGWVDPVWPHQDTPPAAPARDFLRWQVSWLTGRRLRPPSQEHAKLPVAIRSQARRLQLRGQPRHCAGAHVPRSLLIPCGNHRRHPVE